MSKNTSTLPVDVDGISSDVYTAVHVFAESLAESTEFQVYELAAERLGQDETSQQAIQDFQKKQQSLQMLFRLNAVSPADRAELERLQKAYLNQPFVIDYIEAQEKLTALCQAAANLLSQRIGLSFATACGPGCC